jgi:hypothetical protein
VTPVRDQYRAERGQAALILLAVTGLILPGRWCCSRSVRRSGGRGGTSTPPTCGGVGCAGDARSLSAAVRAAPFSRTGSRTAACLGSGVPRAGARGGRAGRASERMRAAASDVSFPGAGFAPTRVAVVARSEAQVRLGGSAAGGWSLCGRARQSWRPTWARRTERRHTGPGAATTDRSPAGWAMRQRAGAGEDCPCSSISGVWSRCARRSQSGESESAASGARRPARGRLGAVSER